jgi:uncharacterized membrane protein
MKMKLKLKLWKIKIYIIAKEFFQYSLITYIILLLAETVKEGIVSYFFNLNILLALVIVSGFVMAITYDEQIPQQATPPKKIKKRDIVWSSLLAIFGGFFIYAGTFELGVIAPIVGCLAAILILLLSLLLLTDKE